jgi:5'-nucleotidase
MPITLDGQLVVAISSRALFDFEEENRVFEASDDRAYMQLQLERVDSPAKPGVAFSLVNKLLAFNTGDAPPRVEVVILSRNDPVSGMRVFRSAKHYGLPIQRGVFTRGQSPWRYLRPLSANLFLSTNEPDVRSALGAGVPAARVFPQSARASDANPHEVRIAFDGDAVLFSDEAEQVFQLHGLSAFQTHELDQAQTPLAAGPFKPLLEALHRMQREPSGNMRARHGTQRAGARTRDPHTDGLAHRRGRSHVPGRPAQGRVPARVRARLFLRRPDRPHRERAGTCSVGPRRRGCAQSPRRLKHFSRRETRWPVRRTRHCAGFRDRAPARRRIRRG